jgi:ketosteroid isomerase-like protein
VQLAIGSASDVPSTLTLVEWLRSNDAPIDDPAARSSARAALRRFYTAIVKRDMDALGEALTPDVIYEFPFSETGSTDPADCRRFIGREAVIEFWRETTALDLRFGAPDDVDLSILADGSRVFLEQRGNIALPSGAKYRNRYIFRYDIREGRIAHVREYINPVVSAMAFGRPLAQSRMADTPAPRRSQD